MNANIPNFLPVVAALIRMYGKSVGVGVYEVHIPPHIIAELSPTGAIQQQPDDPTNPGWRFRYQHNRVIEGKVVSVTPVEPEPPPTAVVPLPKPEAESPPTEQLNEYA